MATSILMTAYRIAATVLATTPIALNVAYSQDIITSFIYVPLVSLVLVGLAMVIDSKLMKILQPQNIEIMKSNTANVEVLPVVVKTDSNNFHHAA